MNIRIVLLTILMISLGVVGTVSAHRKTLGFHQPLTNHHATHPFVLYRQEVPSLVRPESPSVPTIVTAGVAPRLYPSEQGAFKLMQAATQIIQSNIIQNGCINKDYPIVVNTEYDGSGSAVLGNGDPANNIVFNVFLKQVNVNDGRAYTVEAIGKLSGLTITLNDSSGGSFNIGSSMQEMSSNWTVVNPQTGLKNNYTGTVIKDYKRLTGFDAIPVGFSDRPLLNDPAILVNTVLAYGSDQISKNGYVSAKYWQQSRSWRDDASNSGTYWVMTRITPSNVCSIEFKLEGYGQDPGDNLEGFNERGTVHVGTKAIGPLKIR